ncbi:queuine tRNA-ribosyltransferase accessory subunit 2 [Drosophila pseudoobscura]|uniref:Queuine tRNA-ribosyltransferase accessory subunit 2 n=2 Tax=Drosophila pseudoobscura pseudoobscura TaxID=46245 RepID=QTRT2_DROPS|nr:queuine tRNA-ribosyltransferase accessory subunit 2 [Drosophila pseudoobscura]Q29EE9.1 RecName: Full=Queuine tRNA-ribosyltransferase accessory subunit 2; AltName: Full=Queuine tRNA-ribosyltransferase domain-containing protein 1 [Drosophila pseudoobscura pseudoobscura]
MKFVIESLTKNSGRLGRLHIKDGAPGQRTPLLMQTTKGGSIPYLSADVFESHVTETPQLLELTLSTIDHMSEALAQWNSADRGLSDYIGFPGHLNVLLLRDPCETTPAGGNDRDIQPLFTRRGKESLSAQRYMEMVASLRPDIYQGLCDADTNAESAKKRVQKSVDRTEKFMHYIYEHKSKVDSTLLAPIVGGYNTFARTQSIKHALEQPSGSYGGYVFEGFHTNGLSATILDASKLLPIVEHCVGQLEEEKPRMVPGAYTPLTTLELIGLGMDLFDTSYAYCAAVNFKALTFTFVQDEVVHVPLLDITDDAIKEDFSPLLKNCDCLSCQKHTRAYVHHLYKTNELLGPILLMVHNLHHYMAFFEAIRESIARDGLPQLTELVRRQNGDSQVDYSIAPNRKVISKATMGKGFAAAAV